MHRIDRETLVAGSIGIALLMMPFQWIVLAQFMGRSLKPVHLAVGLVGLGFLLVRRPLTRLAEVVRTADYFVLLFSIHIALMILALSWTSVPARGASIVIKQALYFIVFLLIAATIAALPSDRTTKVVYRAAPGGLLLFTAVAVIVFAILGKNLLVEFVTAIMRGDRQWLQFGVYPALFKFSGGFEPGEDAEAFTTRLRNTLVGAFFLYLVLLNTYRPTRNRRGRVWSGAVCTGFSVLAAALILLSVSRSNMLALALCLVLVAGVKVARGWRPSYQTIMLALVLTCALVGSLLVSGQFWAGSSEILWDRFGNLSENARVAAVQQALVSIGEHPLRGYGLLTDVLSKSGGTPRPHNLFFLSWLEVGLAGFIVALAFYGAIVGSWIRHIWMTVQRPQEWRLPIASNWVAALPVLPLVRIQVSGGGAFTLIEWTCLAFFFGILARNDRLQRVRGPDRWMGSAAGIGGARLLGSVDRSADPTDVTDNRRGTWA